MKQFLYLNTDIVNSIIAQEKNGLLQKYTKNVEKSDQKDYSLELSGGLDVGGNLGIKQLSNVEAAFEADLKGGIGKEHQQTIQKIYEKTLHDASFDIAYNIIKPKKINYQKDNADPGEYIEIKRDFDFIDLEYLKNIFSEKGIVDYLIEKKKKEMEQEVQSTINREMRRKNSELINEHIKEETNSSKEEYQKIKDLLDRINTILPYSRLLYASDGYIIPVEEEFFRVNPCGMGFIYGGEMQVVGLITNIIGKDMKPNEPQNVFANIQYGINEIIRGLLPTKDDDLYVVTPIAIYYE